MHLTVIRMWLNLRPQKVTIYTHVYTGTVRRSGPVIIHKHAAHRLVQHRLQVVEMTWTDDSTLAIFFYRRYNGYRSLHRAIVWSKQQTYTRAGTGAMKSR